MASPTFSAMRTTNVSRPNIARPVQRRGAGGARRETVAGPAARTALTNAR